MNLLDEMDHAEFLWKLFESGLCDCKLEMVLSIGIFIKAGEIELEYESSLFGD